MGRAQRSPRKRGSPAAASHEGLTADGDRLSVAPGVAEEPLVVELSTRQGRGLWVAGWLGLGAILLGTIGLLALGEVLLALREPILAAIYTTGAR